MRIAALAFVFVLQDARADHRPIPPSAFSNGIDAHASGSVIAVQTPASPRVFLPTGTFTMGAGMADLAIAQGLCANEPHKDLCNNTIDFRRQNAFDIGRVVQTEMPAHPVLVTAFEIDRTEVTVDAYGRCVAAGACAAAGYPMLDPRFDRPELPVTHVRYDDAKQYCVWIGGRLPTEAEWEYAARGDNGRIFPWGKIYNPKLCNHGSFAADSSDLTDGHRWPAPVGSFKDGATPTGILDMAGNVAEWVADIVDPPFDPQGNVVPGYTVQLDAQLKGLVTAINPVHTKGTIHIARGGAFDSPSFSVRTTARSFIFGTARDNVGFRCAYDTGAPKPTNAPTPPHPAQ